MKVKHSPSGVKFNRKKEKRFEKVVESNFHELIKGLFVSIAGFYFLITNLSDNSIISSVVGVVLFWFGLEMLVNYHVSRKVYWREI